MGLDNPYIRLFTAFILAGVIITPVTSDFVDYKDNTTKWIYIGIGIFTFLLTSYKVYLQWKQKK